MIIQNNILVRGKPVIINLRQDKNKVVKTVTYNNKTVQKKILLKTKAQQLVTSLVTNSDYEIKEF